MRNVVVGQARCIGTIAIAGWVAACGGGDSAPGAGWTTGPLESAAEMARAILDNPDAARVCVGLQACALIEPGHDSNSAFMFDMCLLSNSADCEGRRQRLECLGAHAGDCPALKDCMPGLTYGDGGSLDCEGQTSFWKDATGLKVFARDCRAVVYHGDCIPSGEGCTYSAADVVAGDPGPANRCDGNTLIKTLHGPADETPAQTRVVHVPCGDGFVCTENSPGGTSHDGECVAAGVSKWTAMGFMCNGKTLHFGSENGAGADYDCVGMGYADCQGIRCVW